MKLSTNHTIAKQILNTHPTSFLGLEDLTGIRERTKRQRGKQTTTKQRRANRHASKWAFAELRELLAYKAALAGLVCIRVDADYSSQCCPRCGYTSRANRPQHGLLFFCQQCQFTLHADLVGARNICLRTLLIRQDWISTGQLSSVPDVKDDEAKAARLSRYAEVRWSSATSLLLKQEVLDNLVEQSFHDLPRMVESAFCIQSNRESEAGHSYRKKMPVQRLGPQQRHKWR